MAGLKISERAFSKLGDRRSISLESLLESFD